MRCNKQELMAVASQTSHYFDREGVMLIKERQDGFFRRSEGTVLRWFRLRGNLLFYLRGPESWSEPHGFIVLGHHEITIFPQDEMGNWPFQLVWENGGSYRFATFHETDRTLWIKAIEMAPYEQISAELVVLKERLNRIRPVIEISTYRLQKGIHIDMNEIPICELALSCDNLLCDTHGQPPSAVIVVYVKFHKGLCVRYGATEIADPCSNPCFSKTILFRSCDGLTEDVLVRLVVYNVKERVTGTTVPMGFTAVKLSTIQEAQRLRIAILNKDNKTVGFVTINGWSLEPSYIGSSPNHSSDSNSVEVPQKVLTHRRSQSLPPRLGVKLKFPNYGNLIKMNFLNSHQVTYKFHSGLGGDITVHEIMAEPKVCYQIPIQLLDIYIHRERELLEELLSVGEICGAWCDRQVELVSIHVAQLKRYGHSKRRLQHVDTPYFKPSSKKDEASLEFAPVNLHLQRMWVHNDTLNKTGFHDIVTAGAFAAHTHKADRNGGLIRLVQQVKDINTTNTALCSAAASKIQSDYDNVVAMRRIRDDIVHDLERMVVMLQARQGAEIVRLIEEIKMRLRSFIALWDPNAVEESLSYLIFPKCEAPDQTMTSILQYTERLSLFDTASDCDYASSSSSSKEASPIVDLPPINNLSLSVPNIFPNGCTKNPSQSTTIAEGSELQFHNDYFKTDRNLNHSFRSVKSAKFTEKQSLSFDSKRTGSLRHDFKGSSSLEQVSYRGLMDSASGEKCSDRKGSLSSEPEKLDALRRNNNLMYLKSVSDSVEETLLTVYEAAMLALDTKAYDTSAELDDVRTVAENAKAAMESPLRWMRVAHAAVRLRCEPLQWARENAALQMRRDTCFSQALTTVTAGLTCWLCSVPPEVVVKVLTSGLGPLCGFEGLLSLYAGEKAMWGDMVVAIEDLQTVQFKLVKASHSGLTVPQLTGARGALVVLLPVSESLYSRFMCKENPVFTITAVFFNIGVNDKASMAEALGDTKPQYHSNSDNLDRLNKYYHKYSKILHDHVAESRASSSSRTKPLEEVMENLRIAVHKKIPKNVEVLHLAALATRLMHGIRFTSCKSAKDRTGMAVTLEQSCILSSEYHLAEHEQKKALDIMRSEGCRRENTFKNIGVRKYAFTKKQVMALPLTYRPPPGTYGSTQT